MWYNIRKILVVPVLMLTVVFSLITWVVAKIFGDLAALCMWIEPEPKGIEGEDE